MFRKQLYQHLREGIYQTLVAENISPQLVEKYLEDCGESITYTKTGDRSVVSSLNQLILDLEFYDEPWDEKQVYQPEISRTISGIIYSVRGKYYFVKDELQRQFEEHYDSEL